jgi:hypothetical protein
MPTYAACVGAPCLLLAGMQMIGHSFNHGVTSPRDLLANGNKNLDSLNSEARAHYFSHSLAHATDGDVNTFYISTSGSFFESP